MTKSKQKFLNLTYKIPIIKPVSTDWKLFGKVADDFAYNAIQVMNDAIDMYYLHQREKIQYRKDTGKNMSVKEVYGVGSYNTIINRTLKERHKDIFKKMAGDVFEQIIRQAIDTFNTNS